MADSSKIAVTGAGSGIGRAVSARCTARVFGGACRTAPRSTGADCGLGGRCRTDAAVPTDVGESRIRFSALFDATREAFGHLDLLFNNAGANTPAIPMEELSYQQWASVVAVNLTRSFLCAQQAIQLMKSQDPMGGRIINNGSISAHAPRPHSAPYTATKHAIPACTKSISLDCRRYSIACGQISGISATPPPR